MLRSEFEGDPPAVSRPMAALFGAGGKRLRPALVLLAAKLGSYELNGLATAAMAVEITHAATLVHDDVIDRAVVRRGRPTVAASRGNEPAIVIGDYYLVKAYELAARTGSTEVVAVLARAVMQICAGEVRQYAMRYHYALAEGDYMRWIHDKTASLLAACCDIGALLGGLNADEREALHSYGIDLGLAFQMADDVLDYTGSEDEVGKPIGHDLVEGYATLPLIMAMETPDVVQAARGVLVDGRPLTADEAQRMVALVRESGAPSRAIDRARQVASDAASRLDALRPGPVRDSLVALSTYVVSRKF